MTGLLLAVAAFWLDVPSGPRLPPVEQCAKAPGFEEFRANLRRIVARQDEQALLALLSKDVEVNFGGDKGPDLFAKNWGFAGARLSPVWEELSTALARGCIPTGDALLAPSFSVQFPEDLDPFETWIALPGARLLAKPDDRAEVTARLEWDLMTEAAPRGGDWLAVRLLDGRKGFVRYAETISPLGYRLVFEKRGAKWMITAFVAGD